MVQDSTLNRGTKIGLKHEEKIIQPDEIHHILEPGEFGAVLELIVSDPNTIDPLTGEPKITERRVMKSESFVQQFLQLLFAKMILGTSAAVWVSIRDILNTLRNVYVDSDMFSIFDMTAGATVVTNGIIIGTGITAPTISEYKIETIIPHATMNYSAMTFGAPAADATTSQITLTRNFANVSGGPVTVNEIALYCVGEDGSTRNFMIIRDTIAGGIAVPSGLTLTANYRLQAVV